MLRYLSRERSCSSAFTETWRNITSTSASTVRVRRPTARVQMRAKNAFLVQAGALALCACAVTPAVMGPSVIVLPPQGKDLTQFQGEDASCRQYAATIVAKSANPNSAASISQQQQQYDIAYAQCMAAAGNQLAPSAIRYAPNFPYVDAYPAYYGPWFGSTIGLGFVGVFGPRFHSNHHVRFAHNPEFTRHPEFMHHNSGHRH